MGIVVDTERDEEAEPPKQPESRLALRWITPGERRFFVLHGKASYVGRGDECDIVLTDHRVSRRHARIEKRGPLFVIEDLGSTNGVFVNGKRATKEPLVRGALVRIAQWLAIVEELRHGEVAEPFLDDASGLAGGPALQRVRAQSIQVAASNLPVVLEGETGTGKELFARALHRHSGRKGPLHAINCAALSPGLADAELFGHRKGAFTGADRHRAGHLVAADEGTLFLDEVGDLSLPIQAKLLRALETGEVMAVGDTRTTKVDARIVAATQTPLFELVERGTFRNDLAMRLGGLTLRLPTLAERAGDIPELFHHFIRNCRRGEPPRLSARMCESLCLRAWSGNVRELRLLAEQLVALFPDVRELGLRHLPEPMPGSVTPRGSAPERSSRDADLARFSAALRETGGNVRAAADHAGVSRTRIYRLLRGRNPSELLREPAPTGSNGTRHSIACQPDDSESQ